MFCISCSICSGLCMGLLCAACACFISSMNVSIPNLCSQAVIAGLVASTTATALQDAST